MTPGRLTSVSGCSRRGSSAKSLFRFTKELTAASLLLAGGALLLGVLLVLTTGVSPALAGVNEPRPNTRLTTCDPAAFANAVAPGGVVTFGLDCPDLHVGSTIVIPAGLTVTISSGGHNVVLDGNLQIRLFMVTGGSLTSMT